MNPALQRRSYELPDGQLSAVHFGDTQQPLRLIFLHANGFNALVYKTVLQRLGVHAAAFDMRGHGMSQLPVDPDSLFDWHIFRDDILHVINHHIQGRVVIAGHSYGAVTGILLAPYLKTRMAGYVGFDPLTVPAPFRALSRTRWFRAIMRKHLGIASKAGRRQSRFDTAAQAFERYKGRGAFRRFSDEALNDYLDGGLVADGQGVRLACNPLWEQAIYTAQGHNLFKALKFLPQDNSQVCFASKYGSVSFPAARRALARHIGQDNVTLREDFAHMFPLHVPEFAAAQMSKVIGQAEF